MYANLKSDSALFTSVFIGQFFNHIADEEEQRPCYNLLSSHRFK